MVYTQNFEKKAYHVPHLIRNEGHAHVTMRSIGNHWNSSMQPTQKMTVVKTLHLPTFITADGTTHDSSSKNIVFLILCVSHYNDTQWLVHRVLSTNSQWEEEWWCMTVRLNSTLNLRKGLKFHACSVLQIWMLQGVIPNDSTTPQLWAQVENKHSYGALPCFTTSVFTCATYYILITICIKL
jgi:hypothetical protein